VRKVANGQRRFVVRFMKVVHASPVSCGEPFVLAKRIGRAGYVGGDLFSVGFCCLVDKLVF